jgi:hypothetical protein
MARKQSDYLADILGDDRPDSKTAEQAAHSPSLARAATAPG